MAREKAVPKIRSAYDGSRVRRTVGEGPSMVREAFKDECDINQIVQRYAAGAQMPPRPGDALYADVSGLSDYKSAVDQVLAAYANLDAMPEKARALLKNDPEGFRHALLNATQSEDLVALGILKAPTEEQLAATEEEPPKAQEAPRE